MAQSKSISFDKSTNTMADSNCSESKLVDLDEVGNVRFQVK